MSKLLDLKGKVFGLLTVLERGQRKASTDTYWRVVCVCGGEKEVTSRALVHGRQKSYGCLVGSRNHELFAKRPFESLYNSFKNHRASRPVTITYEQFLDFVKIKNCHYCDLSVSWAEHNMHENGYSYNLDRKDNNLYYTEDNCVVCCKTCNAAKGSKYTYEEWKTMTEALKLYRKSLEVPSAS